MKKTQNTKIILEHNIEAIVVDWIALNRIDCRLPEEYNLIYRGNHMSEDNTDVYAVFALYDDFYAVKID